MGGVIDASCICESCVWNDVAGSRIGGSCVAPAGTDQQESDQHQARRNDPGLQLHRFRWERQDVEQQHMPPWFNAGDGPQPDRSGNTKISFSRKCACGAGGTLGSRWRTCRCSGQRHGRTECHAEVSLSRRDRTGRNGNSQRSGELEAGRRVEHVPFSGCGEFRKLVERRWWLQLWHARPGVQLQRNRCWQSGPTG